MMNDKNEEKKLEKEFFDLHDQLESKKKRRKTSLWLHNLGGISWNLQDRFQRIPQIIQDRSEGPVLILS